MQEGNCSEAKRERQKRERRESEASAAMNGQKFAELAHIEPHSMNGWLPRRRNMKASFVKLEEQIHQTVSKDENRSAD